MLLRAITLSVAILLGIGIMVPLTTESAEAQRKRAQKRSAKSAPKRNVRRYSPRARQQRRAAQQRRRAAQARARALRLRQLRQARARRAAAARARAARARRAANARAAANRRAAARRAAARRAAARRTPVRAARRAAPPRQRAAVLPSGQLAPQGWSAGESNNSELRFNVAGSGSSQAGSASISVVGPATGATVATGRNRALGGVPTTSLRREVINQMIKENGWVVNDYQKEVGGKTVYVVVAQSQAAGGKVESRLFYFTEADGRIYSVATKSATDSAERLAEESENVIRSLQSRPRTVQQAAVKD